MRRPEYECECLRRLLLECGSAAMQCQCECECLCRLLLECGSAVMPNANANAYADCCLNAALLQCQCQCECLRRLLLECGSAAMRMPMRMPMQTAARMRLCCYAECEC